jgi:hypothetical protein
MPAVAGMTGAASDPGVFYFVIASEAKQSIAAARRKCGLLRRFAPRNDG